LSSRIFYDFDDEYLKYVQEVKEYIAANEIFKYINNTTHWEIFFEHVEMIHALNNLLKHDCAFISKTHYGKSISNILKENGVSIKQSLDSSLINSIFRNSGYTITKYDGDGRLHINKIFETFKEEFPHLKVIRDNPSMNIIQSYCKFVDDGVLLGLEVPKTNKKSLEEVISLLSPYSKLGYPIYLKDAHRRAVISKSEMDMYVYSIIKSIGEHDEELGVFFQNGRSVL
jgi:NurA-like 5'-3' nuclease